jgi:hypothetical protein
MAVPKGVFANLEVKRLQMKIDELVYRVLAVVILCAMLLPWSSGSLSGMARAACTVTAGNWHEVGADSACAGGISENSGEGLRELSGHPQKVRSIPSVRCTLEELEETVETLSVAFLGQGYHGPQAIINAADGRPEDTGGLAGIEAQSLGGEGRLRGAGKGDGADAYL